MRKSVLFLLVCLLAVPAAGTAALLAKKGDGTLSVEDGRGVVVLSVRGGGVIGRFDRGAITIIDRSPNDPYEPRVWGASREFDVRGGAGERHAGTNVRFRLIGGEFFILVNATGIELSAVGTGWTTLSGRGRNPGVFSLDGEDCSAKLARCPDLPEEPRTFRLGSDTPDRASAAPLRVR